MIHKYTKWQKSSQTIYCLSDFHIASQPHNLVNNQHRTAIAQAAKARNAIVIVEDALRYFEREPSNKQRYVAPHMRLMQLTPNQASLLGLSSLCYHAGISADNVEFRLGPTAVFNMGHAASRVLAHTQEAIERISNYDDGPIANAWYKKIIGEYHQLSSGSARYFLQQLQEKDDQHVSRALLESIPYNPDIQAALEDLNSLFDWNKVDHYSQKLILLMLFDNTLLDAELIHALVQRAAEKTIFVCAGNDHITRIEPVLKELGYTCTSSEGDDLIPEDIRYKEPKAISAQKLLSLLESKKVAFPLLLRMNLYVHSLLDSKNAHRWIALILYFVILMISSAIMFAIPVLFGLTLAFWYPIIISSLLAQAAVWYAARPTKKKTTVR